jgi:hypothetical protein
MVILTPISPDEMNRQWLVHQQDGKSRLGLE